MVTQSSTEKSQSPDSYRDTELRFEGPHSPSLDLCDTSVELCVSSYDTRYLKRKELWNKASMEGLFFFGILF